MYITLSPPQKMATLVQILFRAAHTYSKDSKKKVSGKLVKKSGRPILYSMHDFCHLYRSRISEHLSLFWRY